MLNRRGIASDSSADRGPCASSSSDDTSSGSLAVSRRIVLDPSNDDRATDRNCANATACAKSLVAPEVSVESAGSSSSLSSVSLEMGVFRPARAGSAARHSAVVGVITTSRTRVSSVQSPAVCSAASELKDMREAYDIPLAGSPARLPCRLRARRIVGRPISGELSVELDVLRDGDRGDDGAGPGLGGVVFQPALLARPSAPKRVSSGEPASSGSEL